MSNEKELAFSNNIKLESKLTKLELFTLVVMLGYVCSRRQESNIPEKSVTLAKCVLQRLEKEK